MHTYRGGLLTLLNLFVDSPNFVQFTLHIRWRHGKAPNGWTVTERR